MNYTERVLGLYKIIARRVLPPGPSEEETLLFMALIHTHAICLDSSMIHETTLHPTDVLSNQLAAVTQRVAAEVAASLWPVGSEQGRYEYWYNKYVREMPYEFLSDATGHHRALIEGLRDVTSAIEFVDAVIEED